MGKFKNKRVIVKDFGIDDHGLPTINGKPILKIRIPKIDPTMNKKETKIPTLANLFKEAVGDNEITVQASSGSGTYELFYRGTKDPASVGKILNKRNIDFKITDIEEEDGEYTCVFEIDIASLFAELFWEDGFRFKKLR